MMLYGQRKKGCTERAETGWIESARWKWRMVPWREEGSGGGGRKGAAQQSTRQQQRVKGEPSDARSRIDTADSGQCSRTKRVYKRDMRVTPSSV